MKHEELSEALVRLENSEHRLKNLGFEVHQGLPLYPLSSEIQPRAAKEAAYRAMCLTLLAAKGEGLELKVVEHVLSTFQIELHLSVNELSFLRDINPTPKDRIYFAWKYEAVCVLWWYIGFWTELPFPKDICESGQVVQTMLQFSNTEKLIAAMKPISIHQLLNESDFHFRCLGSLEWAIIQKLNYPEVNKDVLIERFFTFQWLTNPVVWDDISTLHFEV